ncbi:unnamed protein product [Ascophyllum nodosum]
MTAESFCDYLNTEILPQVAATATSDYDPFKGTPAIKATTEIMADVQTFCRKVANYHEVYRQELTGPEAVAKRQTFKSHRRPAPSEFITPT